MILRIAKGGGSSLLAVFRAIPSGDCRKRAPYQVFHSPNGFVPIVAELKLALQNKAVKVAMPRVIHRIVYDAALTWPRGEGSRSIGSGPGSMVVRE